MDVFTTTEEVGIVFSLACAIEYSLVPLTVVVFNVLKELTGLMNSVEYFGSIVGRMTVVSCNGADILGCTVVADAFKSNARDLVNVTVSVLDVEISRGVVVLSVEVFENVTDSVMVVPEGNMGVSDVVSVVFSVVKASVEGRVLILVSNLAEVGDISMLGATVKFVLMDCDGAPVVLRVVVIVRMVTLGLKTLVVHTVMVEGVDASDLGGYKEVFIDSSATGM